MYILFFYLILGLYLSVNTGITADELTDQYNWELRRDAIKDFFNIINGIISRAIITN